MPSSNPPVPPPPCRPRITAIDRFTTDLTTKGGPVNVHVRNMGFGRHVSTLLVGMTFRNANFSYTATNCFMHWNGSTVSCVAPEGVGNRHRWTMLWANVTSNQSEPGVVTNYKGPVLYDIFSEFNQTKTSESSGGDVFNVTGENFGPLAENAVFWVRYAPYANPAIVFEANCSLVVAHNVLRCFTGPQAGGDLRWTINVAGQVSIIPFTTTHIPVVQWVQVLQPGTGLSVLPSGEVVGASRVRAAGRVPGVDAALGVSTSGGGIVILHGMYVPVGPPPPHPSPPPREPADSRHHACAHHVRVVGRPCVSPL